MLGKQALVTLVVSILFAKAWMHERNVENIHENTHLFMAAEVYLLAFYLVSSHGSLPLHLKMAKSFSTFWG